MNVHFISSSLVYFPINIFFFLLFLLSTIKTSYSLDDEQLKECSLPYGCGRIQGIRYPFWGDDRPQFCGHPGFELKCVQFDDGTGEDQFMFDYNSQRFRVLEINSTKETITMARNDLWETTCLEEFVNTTLNFALFRFIPEVRNLNIFYGCNTSQISMSIRNNFTCSGNTTAVYADESLAGIGNPNYTEAGCRVGIQVPVLRTALDKLVTGENPTLQEIVNQGFTLGYIANCLNCSSGRLCAYNSSQQQFVCLPAQPPGRGGLNLRWKFAIGLGVSFGVVFICISICCFKRKLLQHSFVIWTWKTKKDEQVEAFIRNFGSLAPKRYSHSDIKKITNSFKDKIGQGGYGNVYKGKLLDNPVAVKVLNPSKGNGEEFINEVASISRTSHVNIVSLLGFCLEGERRALIYEFMPNGSLEKFIYNENALYHQLGLEKLHQIAVGIAQGLDYLHLRCNTRILHFDIKPHNILLDEDFCPKISDFGLAKLCPRKNSMISMLEARGTIGYIAPEVFCRNFGGVSSKSDVYSYGMMVLEMVGGRNNIHSVEGHSSDIYFPQWIYNRLELDSGLNLQGVLSDEENKIARKMVLVGLWCIQTDPSHRPAIREVMDMLEGSIDALPFPPKPFLSSPPMLPEMFSTLSTVSIS